MLVFFVVCCDFAVCLFVCLIWVVVFGADCFCCWLLVLLACLLVLFCRGLSFGFVLCFVCVVT